jgi:hypothetical protein
MADFRNIVGKIIYPKKPNFIMERERKFFVKDVDYAFIDDDISTLWVNEIGSSSLKSVFVSEDVFNEYWGIEKYTNTPLWDILNGE